MKLTLIIAGVFIFLRLGLWLLDRAAKHLDIDEEMYRKYIADMENPDRRIR